MQTQQVLQTTAHQIVWATESEQYKDLGEWISQGMQHRHWSRIFEYPWVIYNGKFHHGQEVLDAAGGDSPLQYIIAYGKVNIINIDIDPSRVHSQQHPLIKRVTGDIRDIPYPDNHFDRVMCISALEHIERPAEAIKELWRVLKPGGRLLVTMDVAHYKRWNHTIDEGVAEEMLALFGFELPVKGPTTLCGRSVEIMREDEDPEEVYLCVLCFYMDKPV